MFLTLFPIKCNSLSWELIHYEINQGHILTRPCGPRTEINIGADSADQLKRFFMGLSTQFTDRLIT